MYEEIRKPRMLQDVPISIIRPLPVLYYSNKFVTRRIGRRIQELYHSNLIYLGDALNEIAYIINNNEFRDLSLSIRSLSKSISDKNFNNIQLISIELSRLCTQVKSELRKNSIEIKTKTMSLYTMQVDPLKVLLISMDQNTDHIQKVLGVLKGFCQYSINCSDYNSSDLNQKIVNADYILFSSTSSPDIHQQVKKLKTYQMPGLALVPIDIKGKNLEKAIRHGSQLIRNGFPVLFRVFTPLRLFTTIEKTYLAYHLL